MSNLLNKDYYEKFKILEEDLKAYEGLIEEDLKKLEEDLERLYDNLEKNKVLLNGLDKELSPCLDALSSHQRLKLPLSVQKGYLNFNEDLTQRFKSEINNLNSLYDYRTKNFVSRLLKKAKNIIHSLLNLDKINHISQYNSKLLELYNNWVQSGITEIQDNLFLQNEINQTIITVCLKTIMLMQKFNEISFDQTMISEIKQRQLNTEIGKQLSNRMDNLHKNIDMKINLIRDKEGFLIKNLMQEESFKKYLDKINSLKDNMNYMILRVKELLNTINKHQDTDKDDEPDQIITDQLYSEFESYFRGDKEQIKLNFQQYIDIVADKQPVVDIGCGRGEFLELLKENRIKGYGVDINQCMINMKSREDIKIINKDAILFLKTAKDESIGSIFSSQLVEHFKISLIDLFLREAYRVLKKDGVLVIETLDPSSFIGYHYYYLLDPTHKTPVHPQYIKFLADSIGFRDSYIYRPKKDYDSIVDKQIRTDLIKGEVPKITINAFLRVSEKFGDIPEFALISKK